MTEKQLRLRKAKLSTQQLRQRPLSRKEIEAHLSLMFNQKGNHTWTR